MWINTNMAEFRSEHFPFKTPGQLILETRHRLIAGIEPGVVIKVAKIKSDRAVFQTVNAALGEIRENDDSRALVHNLLVDFGVSGGVISPTKTIIHSTPSGDGITYTEVQTWYKDSVPLAHLRKDLFKLPISTLDNLRGLIRANQYLLKNSRTCFELDGSNGPFQPSLGEKVARNLLPLFFSYNILVDPKGRLQLVDVESLEKYARFTRSGVRGWARRQFKNIGFSFSLGILDTVSLSRKF